MADSFARMKVGAKRPLYGSATAASGTLTITGQPTVSVYDSTGTVVSGLSGLNTTGYDSSAAATVRAWYTLDTTTPAVLTAGFYTVVISFSATSSVDSITRNFKDTITLQVVSVTG